jgi:hypothetical protein
VCFVCGDRADGLRRAVGDASAVVRRSVEAVAAEAVFYDVGILTAAVSSCVPEAREYDSIAAVVQEGVVLDEGALNTTLEAVKVVVTEGVSRDRANAA